MGRDSEFLAGAAVLMVCLASSKIARLGMTVSMTAAALFWSSAKVRSVWSCCIFFLETARVARLSVRCKGMLDRTGLEDDQDCDFKRRKGLCSLPTEAGLRRADSPACLWRGHCWSPPGPHPGGLTRTRSRLPDVSPSLVDCTAALPRRGPECGRIWGPSDDIRRIQLAPTREEKSTDPYWAALRSLTNHSGSHDVKRTREGVQNGHDHFSSSCLLSPFIYFILFLFGRATRGTYSDPCEYLESLLVSFSFFFLFAPSLSGQLAATCQDWPGRQFSLCGQRKRKKEKGELRSSILG